MGRIIREPLLHFAVAGALLFMAYSWVNRRAPDVAGDTARVVRIEARDVEWLKQTWQRQWSRQPTEAELRGLASEYLREELLCREARELGLDRDDTVVRRRLAQKMAFLVEDVTRAVEPTEEELRRLHEAQPQLFESPAEVSFTQVFFNRDRRGATAEADARRALAELNKGGSGEAAAGLGDRFLLEDEFIREGEQRVASLFGREFARAVFALEPGKWSGPVESGYGLHLVRVTEAHGRRQVPFAESRDKVLEEWRRQSRKKLDDQYIAGLLQKYEVVADDSVKALINSALPAREAQP